jgi:hypothetical protein
MTIKDAIVIFEMRDDWRRTDLVHKYDPKLFDEAIKVAIDIMEKYLELIKTVENDTKREAKKRLK